MMDRWNLLLLVHFKLDFKDNFGMNFNPLID